MSEFTTLMCGFVFFNISQALLFISTADKRVFLKIFPRLSKLFPIFAPNSIIFESLIFYL